MLEVRSSHVSVKDNLSVAIWVILYLVRIGQIFVAIHQHIRMGVAPNERSKLYELVGERSNPIVANGETCFSCADTDYVP